MRISDWSSDVCSSDLLVLTTPKPIPGGDGALLAALARPATIQDDRLAAVDADFSQLPKFGAPGTIVSQTALDRKSVVSGKSVSVRVGLGGCRIIKKKNAQQDSKRGCRVTSTH